MANTTNIDPCNWDISLSWDNGSLDGVSVRRHDGLPFEHLAWEIEDHVRAILAARGLDAGNQAASLDRGYTLCIILDL